MILRVGGRDVFAATGGRPIGPDRPLVIMIHGAGMDRTVWNGQSRALAHHGRSVLAVDLPGHGRSPAPALAEIPAMADLVAELIGAAGFETAALVGHSMGALVALRCAAAHPGRVARLALLGAAARMPVNAALLADAAAGRHAALDAMVLWGVGRSAHLGGNPAPGLWTVGAALRLLETADPASLSADLSACDAWTGAAADAAAIACPTLVLCGAEDRMTPVKGGRALAATIAGGRVEVLDACGHMMMIERPDRVLDVLADFLEIA